ncbi:uncharacterized protein LOC130648106 [Hydractinia symbiolongicarpus]|uniref:uncharacterized protein LOC130648106 n=1 Tax=Hydractinia symbiolongicarpus TaxID=13093 RepID=UPI0025504561|nr:uncharacterized protein LOC130648106 [Hydractinia symbiolongicarpus]
MDDYLDCMKTVGEAVSIAKTVTEAWKSCSFRLTKWLSNSCEILECFPSTETAFNFNLDLNKLPTDRVLVVNKASLETKRGILSLTSSIFDPLGILTPFILEGKLIIQSLWKSKVDWDEEIPTELKTRWLSWRSELEKLTSINIPRWYKLQSVNQLIQLHIFSDALINAYGAVAYLRIQETHTVNVTFVMGKYGVAPLNPKSLTIPKLELQAAFLARRMRESKYSDVNSWRFVPGTLNPTDNATRYVPLSPTENSRWLTGTLFLIEGQCNWPDQSQNVNQSEEDADITNFQSTSNAIPEKKSFIKWQSYSDWQKLCRHIAWIIKLEPNWLLLRRGGSEKFDYLTVDEIEATKLQLYSISQQESYPSEFENLQSHKELPKRSPLVALRPMMQNNLIRVGGRTGLIDILFESKHQVIISPKHYIARLIIQHIHHTKSNIFQTTPLSSTVLSVIIHLHDMDLIWIMDLYYARRE